MDNDLLWRGFSFDSVTDEEPEVESASDMGCSSFRVGDNQDDGCSESYAYVDCQDNMEGNAYKRDEEVEAGTGVLFIDETPRYKSYSCSESDDEDDKVDDHAEFQNVGEDKEDESETTGFMPWSFDEPTFHLDQGKSKRQKWTTSQARLSIINELKTISSPAHEKEEDEWENYFYEVSTCIFGASVLFCRPYNSFDILSEICSQMDCKAIQWILENNNETLSRPEPRICSQERQSYREKRGDRTMDKSKEKKQRMASSV